MILKNVFLKLNKIMPLFTILGAITGFYNGSKFIQPKNNFSLIGVQLLIECSGVIACTAVGAIIGMGIDVIVVGTTYVLTQG